MAKQTINIGTSANAGDGDPLRSAFDKINDNFDEVYSDIASLAAGNVVSDLKGSVFADDSTLLVDAVNGVIVGPIVSTGVLTGSVIGTVDGDLTGSVFADDSTLLVDAVNGKIVGPVEASTITSSSYVEAGSVNANVFGVKTVGSFINLGTNASSVNVVTDVDMMNNTINNATVSGYISVADLQTLVAASIDFTDFQTRIAAL